MENQDLKENVKLNLRSVTQSCKGGVPFDRLQRDYRDLLGSPIPFRELGYTSLEAFIRAIPDTISLKKNSEGQLMAMGVADASTAHIVSLVSRQKQDSRKKTLRKPSSFYGGGKRSASSRFTFREGSRGSHSRYTSPPQTYSIKSPKAKPSKPPVPTQHSKFRATTEQVPSRKYEVAPRFLKKKEVENGSTSQELIAPTTHTSQEHIPSTMHMSQEHIRPTMHMSQEHVRPKTVPSSLPTSLNSTEVIPPPRAVGRSLPVKPQPLIHSRTAHLSDLESARSAKEFVEIYSRMNNMTPVYRTVLFGQKRRGFVSTLKLNDKSYQSYPDMKPTEDLAEEEAAKKAMAAIKELKEDMNRLPETPYSNTEEIRNLLSKIEEIVCEKPSGMFDNGIVREYEHKFHEKLPSCWPELLKESGCLEIEELKVEYGKVPDGVNFIVHQTKELSSGNRTPSSTSSKTEYVYEDLDTKALKKTLVNMSSPKVPEFVIPTGNFWEVYITDVTDSISARLFDYSDDFLTLSDEMSHFYKSRNFPVLEISEFQVYAACLDDNPDIWHRVVVDEIKEDGQISCYFVDEGDISSVKKENLQEMSPCFLNLPYQAIHLSLHDLEEYENCIRTDILEKHLLGQTLIAEVKRWYETPEFFPEIPGINKRVYSVVLYDTSDESTGDVNLNEFLKKTTIESLTCKLPKLSTTSCAYLSHVSREGCVYLRLTNPQHCWIEQEMERFSHVFEEASTSITKIPLNTMCAAKYESGTWHRAVVTDNLDLEMVEVFFVDYGHVGFVGKSEICELQPISELLASAPHQAISCELSNALPSPRSCWTDLATAKILELAPFDQELLIRVVSEGDGKQLAKVNLYKRNQNSEIISINDSLSCNLTLFYEEPVPVPIKAPTMLPLRQNSRKSSLKSSLSGVIPDVAVPAEEQMAKRLGTSLSSDKIEWLNTPDNIKSPDALELQSPISLNLPSVPDEKELFNVFVTLASHPHNFVVQPLDSCSELDKLMKDMTTFYSIEENLLEMDFSMLRKNEYYAAQHSDEYWYRARIEHISNGNPVMVAVHYVDFGDFNTVCIGRLQPLYTQFKQLPCQAIKASLAGVKPLDIDWDPVHCVKFQEMLKEKSFVSVIVKKHLDMKENIPSLFLELTLIDTRDPAKDVYIHELLIEKNYAKSH